MQLPRFLVSALSERESGGFDRFIPCKISPTDATYWSG